MTTGYSYDGTINGTSNFVTQLALMAVVEPDDINFLAALPQAITYAENRIYREVDFLSTRIAAIYQMTIGQRFVSISNLINKYPFLITEQANIITPAGTVNPDGPSATRVPCQPVTKEFLDAVFGSPTYKGLPNFYAPFTDDKIFFGPVPNQNYSVEIVGTARPESLSATNKTTFLSLYIPDVFLAAAMIYIGGYQRNFSSTGSDPQMPMNWEQQYKTLVMGAQMEEARKKYQGAAWSSMIPAQAASPSRG